MNVTILKIATHKHDAVAQTCNRAARFGEHILRGDYEKRVCAIARIEHPRYRIAGIRCFFSAGLGKKSREALWINGTGQRPCRVTDHAIALVTKIEISDRLADLLKKRGLKLSLERLHFAALVNRSQYDGTCLKDLNQLSSFFSSVGL